jgi:hypothetical protein
MPAAGADDLANVHVELKDAVAIVHLARPAKRNALNDETVFRSSGGSVGLRNRSRPLCLSAMGTISAQASISLN